MKRYTTIFLVLLLFSSCHSNQDAKNTKIFAPEKLYKELYFDIMENDSLFGKDKLFTEAKDFVDMVPLYAIDTIMAKYEKLQNKYYTQTISRFIHDNFSIPHYNTTSSFDSSNINVHIKKLWHFLVRQPDSETSGTLIPLRHPYIVPGGRFREIYYWDSYFTMLGLQADGQGGMIQNMIDNFSDIIMQYGFIPNGNRTYYTGRSQPPFYALMIDLLADLKGNSVYVDYLPYMLKEYQFWMHGYDTLNAPGDAFEHVVLLDKGVILNRYWDAENTPRPEAYRQDIQTASMAAIQNPKVNKENLFRNLRAAAESGWDFSSRWLANEKDLYTIETINIIPVDLNALLYHLELTIAKGYAYKNDMDKQNHFLRKAQKRKHAIFNYCWNKKKGFFMDYNFVEKQQTRSFSLAGVFPLYLNIANKAQALLVAQKISQSFLKQGGVVTTLIYTHQQWDYPNGWAPLQWATITGLKNYGQDSLANEIKNRWCRWNEIFYSRTHKLFEKYNVVDMQKTGGGEYPNQDGFGWTNGVYSRLVKEK